ncbi:MAG: hypothetical protein HY657_08170 [Acidobacteria bacterium]|nr:hypothetical protein [Acidobacteriota bacterium]
MVALAVLCTSCTRPEQRGPFRNQYIDVETGQPIEGVVFLVVWESVTPTPTGDGGRSFYEAREAVSGPDGRVEIPALTGPIVRISLDVRFHEFAPGYGYASRGTQVTPPDGRPYIDRTVTFMRRLKTREERCAAVDRPLIPAVPGDVMPRFTTAVHVERDMLKCGLLR